MEQARDAVQEVTHGAAADVARNARDTAATAGSAAWNTVREHPIPVALAGLGLGWLLTHRSAVQQTGQHVSEAREQIAGPMGAAATQVQETAQQIGSQIGSQAATQVNRAGGALQQALHDNPLAVGAAALAVGAVVALAVPQTQQEHQVLGPARDQMVAKAQESAHEVVQSRYRPPLRKRCRRWSTLRKRRVTPPSELLSRRGCCRRLPASCRGIPGDAWTARRYKVGERSEVPISLPYFTAKMC